MITHVGKVTIYVSSQTEAKAFWVDGIGFEVTFEQKAGPILWLEVAPPGKNLTSLVLYDKAAMLAVHPEAVAHPTIFFEANEIDAFWNLLRSRGVQVEDLEHFSYRKMFKFYDPDGNEYMVRE